MVRGVLSIMAIVVVSISVPEAYLITLARQSLMHSHRRTAARSSSHCLPHMLIRGTSLEAMNKVQSLSRIACALLIAPIALVASSARADCVDDAASWQHLNPPILRAIAWQESHNSADATHSNANGSVGYGVMKINSIHLRELKQYGIRRDALMVPCKNMYIAAWNLRKQVVRYSDTWTAVGGYHSATPALRDDYAR